MDTGTQSETEITAETSTTTATTINQIIDTRNQPKSITTTKGKNIIRLIIV